MARRPGRLLLAAALCCLAAAARADTYTVVWGSEDLLRALALAAASPFNQSVIELPRDVSLDASAAATYELPLRIKGRLVLRRGELCWLPEQGGCCLAMLPVRLVSARRESGTNFGEQTCAATTAWFACHPCSSGR